MGDELLIQIADRLRAAVRGSDSVGRSHRERLDLEGRGKPISRLGGDEFTILLQDLEHAQDAARVARRVLHSLSRPFEVRGREIFVGASIGISVSPDDGSDTDTLLAAADVAMYHAKGRGGNAYFSGDERHLDATAPARDRPASCARAGPARALLPAAPGLADRARLGGRGADPLDQGRRGDGPSRRVHPRRRRDGDDRRSGMILRTACRQLVQWREEGFEPIRMLQNLSVERLRDLGIANAVEQVLFDTGLSTADLELEITESRILDQSANIVAGIGVSSPRSGSAWPSTISARATRPCCTQRFPIDRRRLIASFGDRGQ